MKLKRNFISFWQVAREGRIDGRLSQPVPHWDALALPPYLNGLAQAGNSTVAEIAAVYKQSDAKSHAKWAAVLLKLLHSVQVTHAAAVSLAYSERHYEEEHRCKAPASDHRFSWYLAAAILFALGELPMNTVAFYVFGESQIMTYVMALGLAGALILAAHLIGIYSRRRRFAAAIGMATCTACAVGGIAFFRMLYVLHKPSANVSLSPPIAICVFASFNLLLIAVMSLLSYATHEEALRQVFSWRKTRAGALSRQRSTHKRYAQAYTKRVALHSHAIVQAELIDTIVRDMFDTYRTHNLRVRRDRGNGSGYYPACFGQYIDLAIPTELAVLAWQASPEAVSLLAELRNNKELHFEDDIPGQDTITTFVAHECPSQSDCPPNVRKSHCGGLRNGQASPNASREDYHAGSVG